MKATQEYIFTEALNFVELLKNCENSEFDNVWPFHVELRKLVEFLVDSFNTLFTFSLFHWRESGSTSARTHATNSTQMCDFIRLAQTKAFGRKTITVNYIAILDLQLSKEPFMHAYDTQVMSGKIPRKYIQKTRAKTDLEMRCRCRTAKLCSWWARKIRGKVTCL